MPLKSALKKPPPSLPDQVSQWASLAIVAPIQDVAKSWGIIPSERNEHEEEDDALSSNRSVGVGGGGGGPGEDEVLSYASGGVVTLICTREGEGGNPKRVQVLPSDTFEEVLDFIRNEFGETLWPVLQDPFTGARLVVINDRSFDELMRKAGLDGGKAKVVLYKKLILEEYEVWDD